MKHDFKNWNENIKNNNIQMSENFERGNKKQKNRFLFLIITKFKKQWEREERKKTLLIDILSSIYIWMSILEECEN